MQSCKHNIPFSIGAAVATHSATDGITDAIGEASCAKHGTDVSEVLAVTTRSSDAFNEEKGAGIGVSGEMFECENK